MEQVKTYNLLQAVDPTKIKVPISERFAKLTLSSNKKKQQQQDEAEQQKQLQRLHEKRDSVSRDISKQFDGDSAKAQNPILRSESSKDAECSNSDDGDVEEFTMDPLEVSQDYDNPTQLEEDLELLSQQVASMVVESGPISLSSSSTDNLSEEHTQLISSESQRSSTSEANNIRIVRNIPINVKEVLKQESVALNLTNSTNDQFEKPPEMADDEYEDEEEDDEDEPITISDTSESHHEQEQDVMATSSLPSTSSTSENLVLPRSLSDNKAERVAAFLRDVSIERRAMVEQGEIEFNDTVDQILDNSAIDKIQEAALVKSRQIATADTESMTPDVDEEVAPRSLLEREKRLKALEGLLEKKQTNSNNSEIVTESDEKNDNPNLHRLANDETQANTELSELEEENDVEKTPKILTNLKTLEHTQGTPKSSQNYKENVYRFANDETQCNTEYSLDEEANLTPKIQLSNIKPTNSSNHRLANLATEENTEFSLPENGLSPNKKNKETDPRRLLKDDTLANSTIPGIEEANYSQNYKTPEKKNEGRNYSPISIQSTPQNSAGSADKTTPELSITISETDDELLEENSPAEGENSDSKKLSNSFQREHDSSDDSEYDDHMSQIQMAMANINISAKINIKIHIPNNTSTETSEDDQNYEPDGNEKEERRSKESNHLESNNQQDNNGKDIHKDQYHSIHSNDQSMESESADKACDQLQSKAPIAIEEVTDSSNSSFDSVQIVEDKKFLTEAEKLLTQLYGKSWQTPDVMRTLKHSSQSGSNKKPSNSKSSSRKKNLDKDSNDPKSNNKSIVEEIILDDFSIFRRDIVKTNLDSTRLVTTKADKPQHKKVFTESRNTRKPLIQKETDKTKVMPQTERKPFHTPAAKVVISKGRVDNDRWRQLIDDAANSEGDNASDDDDADESWSKNASEIEPDTSESDFENSPRPKARKRKNNTTKRSGRSDKSDFLTKKLNETKEGEIVYLDLSKEEVEVQDEVPKSPPANHDVTFASRLQDILKTCRHEDKAKLPSSTKKTKRKLFTPNFGDDDFEAFSPPQEDEAKAKENNAKTLNRNNNNDEELLEDHEYIPFDSHGLPKVLNLVNKQLESVKTGKPIFQLTPSPKKKTNTPSTKKDNNKSGGGSVTPKTKFDNEGKFKTPLTVKSKGPAKTLHELCPTPNYKYSFLKSLDVAVSRSFCHPDAVYYRDNFRTKKEDLTKILYEMYNEKLFNNKLDVSIAWNKKLSNTAGRCLNRKKLGVRSSSIQLSDKVLTSSDRLRCTLIHELCHAATWIFNGEGGHGSTWKEWARRANVTFPEIPKIGVCHQYDIEYKYTYKCTLCAAKSHAHSKSKKVENIRCSYCHGAIEIFLNKKDKDGNIMPTPVKEPTGFAKFVKDNYKKFKRDDLKHADVMKLLSTEFASLKVASN